MAGGSLWIFFSSRRRHTRCIGDWSSDVCSSDLKPYFLRNISQVSGLRNRFHVSSVEGPIGNTPGGFRKAVKPPEVSVPPKKQRFPAGEVGLEDYDERNSLPDSKVAWSCVRSGGGKLQVNDNRAN